MCRDISMNGLRKLSPAVAVGTLTLALGCTEKLPVVPELDDFVCTLGSAAVSGAPAQIPQLDTLFAVAGTEFGVPAPLLKAIGYVETRWQMVEGHPEFPGQPAAYGIMAIKDDQLEPAAALAGVAVREARQDPAANIRAAAALLRHYADELGVALQEIDAWAPAVARYSGIVLSEGRSAYVHQDVYGTLRRGVARDPRDPFTPAQLAPMQVSPHFPLFSTSVSTAPVDFPGARWRPSPNYNARPAGSIGKVAMVIIHTCEGSYTGCWSWLAHRDSRVSAHYVIREDGSEVTQMVREADRGWHIGSNYDCALNQRFECWRNGQSNNHFTIAIEHAGYASQTRWPAAQLDASARLVCSIAQYNGITPDNLRIVGHAQLQPHNRTDPGKNWPWAEYYARINAHCGSGDSPRELVVDTDNGRNDPARSYVSVSRNWTPTTATPGFYGGGYYFAPTGGTADPAVFHFYLPTAGRRTIDAWWTAGGNRSAAATFRAVDGNGRLLGAVTANQRRNGSRWNQLGSWNFPAGWNSIELSREAPRGCVVIADAVRVR
jgi:N-acetyl-anhydromuramyl-L-alanine amidase AmpD